MIKNLSTIKKDFNTILKEDTAYIKGDLKHLAKYFFKRQDKFIRLAKENKSPFYIFDQKEFDIAINNFAKTFTRYIPRLKIYYAMKSNPHPYLLTRIVKVGHNIDVSSGRELAIAAKLKPRSILFTGPGKTEDELQLALKHTDRVILNIDSFTELSRIGRLAAKHKRKISAGIRIFTPLHGLWSKFGIPLNDLSTFWKEAQKYPYIDLQGIQVHMSWSDNAEPYIKVIKEISKYLMLNFSKTHRASIKFLDLGGGFMPYKTEGIHPWSTKQGAVINAIAKASNKQIDFSDSYYFEKTATLEEYAKSISNAVNTYIAPNLSCDIFVEPGRILSSYAMHILLKVADVKSTKKIITDGGINIIGWEKFEEYYAPVLNLTHPSTTEIPCTIFGSLCTPDDIWGYSCFASKMETDDILLIPYQGAYTYTFRQEFIKSLPNVVKL